MRAASTRSVFSAPAGATFEAEFAKGRDSACASGTGSGSSDSVSCAGTPAATAAASDSSKISSKSRCAVGAAPAGSTTTSEISEGMLALFANPVHGLRAGYGRLDLANRRKIARPLRAARQRIVPEAAKRIFRQLHGCSRHGSIGSNVCGDEKYILAALHRFGDHELLVFGPGKLSDERLLLRFSDPWPRPAFAARRRLAREERGRPAAAYSPR